MDEFDFPGEDTLYPTIAFGKTFTHIPEHVRQDLGTLERECVVYSDLWIEEVGDFRHVRIEFSKSERDEFARRSWACELFLRTDATWAADVAEIDEDIARDADTYSGAMSDGTELVPPYHCFAAFLGRHLEALTCFRNERRIVIDLEGRDAALFEVKRTIDTLTATIRSFNNREARLTPWEISCEKDVRDLLYVMLRPRIFDIAKETAIPPKAGTHKFADLCSESVSFLLELKWIGQRGEWKRKVEELQVDVQTYVTHPACKTLFFVIVDNVRDIQDPVKLESELTGRQTIDDKAVDVITRVLDT